MRVKVGVPFDLIIIQDQINLTWLFVSDRNFEISENLSSEFWPILLIILKGKLSEIQVCSVIALIVNCAHYFFNIYWVFSC